MLLNRVLNITNLGVLAGGHFDGEDVQYELLSVVVHIGESKGEGAYLKYFISNTEFTRLI